jgi:hypothetical protein
MKSLIKQLDRLSLDQLRTLSDAELRRFEALCYHWQAPA